MKVLAGKWKNMSQARKEPYERQAEYDSRRYQLEVSFLTGVLDRFTISGNFTS